MLHALWLHEITIRQGQANPKLTGAKPTGRRSLRAGSSTFQPVPDWYRETRLY
jgi:hypothetical protein